MPSNRFDAFMERMERLATERPTCRKCRHPMRVGGNCPDAIGYQKLAFECSTCGHFETLDVPVGALRTDTVGWLASELRPPK
jgi:hypothetical protein